MGIYFVIVNGSHKTLFTLNFKATFNKLFKIVRKANDIDFCSAVKIVVK